MSGYGYLLVEVFLVGGGALAFYIWQMRDIKKTQDRLNEQKDGAQKSDEKATD